MAPRRGAPVEEEEPEQEGGSVRLQFDEPLSWRAGKPIPVQQLMDRLDRLSKELVEMDQDEVDTSSLTKVSKELASQAILGHKDKGVRAYAACCIVDVLRICAPNAPFTESQLKDFFSLCVNAIIPALFDPTNTYNNQHKHVLFSFAEVKSIVLLNDVEGSDNLLLNLFSTIFDGVSGVKSPAGEQIPKDVEYNMQAILEHLVDESTGLPTPVVDVIMAQFLRAAAPGATKDKQDHVPIDENQATLLLRSEPEAYQMAKNICLTYPDKMARFVSQYFSDVIMDASGLAGKSNGQKADDSDEEDGPAGPSEFDLKELRKAHLLIREMWRAAPTVLQNVVPQLEAELSADNIHLRQLATETLGDMISGIGAAGPPPPSSLDPATYPPLRLDDEAPRSAANPLTTPLSSQSFSQTYPSVYHNFLSRKNDKTPSIRAAWTTAAGYILSTSAGGIGLSREEELLLVQGLGEKLTDSDEKVRLAAVKAIESFSFRDVISKLAINGGVGKEGSLLSTLADRCRDKRPAVRVEAMVLLAKLWAVGSGELIAGNEAVVAAISGVPSRIFNAFYANDLELNVLLDRVIYECLVPLSYPPVKKSSKAANGSSQSQSAAAPADQDAIRAERILLLARSLDAPAKKAFFAMQARQPQFAKIMETYVKQCEAYNAGVIDEDKARKTSNLDKAVKYIAQFLPDDAKTVTDLMRIAKINERRYYHLIRYVIGQEHDFKTVSNAFKELVKRLQGGKDAGVLDTLIPLLYRSGCIMFNRSNLSTIMDYSKSDKDGLGAVAHEILNEISQRNPDLFKTHIGQLCKDLVDQAPSATEPNDPAVVETLKACASYSRKYPQEVPMDRKFIQTMINYALYGQPPKAAKYAVNVLMSKKDDKSLVTATDLLRQVMTDWTYDSPNFLNKLTAVSQLELTAAKVVEEREEDVLNMAVQQILLQVRKEANEKDPDWVEDADLDTEIQAKCIALKVLVNRLRTEEDAAQRETKAKPVFSLLRKLIRSEGELCKTADTPKHHRSRLRLLAGQLILKLCQQKHFDEMIRGADFDSIARLVQDQVQAVRHGFVQKLQKYLVENKLKLRWYTLVFMTAFEPVTDFRERVETWIRSRARQFQTSKQNVLEATMPRLISLLAHHPDYSADTDDLLDHARYLVFYIGLVGTESNLGLIHKYAERVKQTNDGIDPSKTENLRVVSDLAQAVVRKWQEKRSWTFETWSDKVGLPTGLYSPLASHEEAQAIAEKQYIPDDIDEKLDELIRVLDRKKKRRPADDRHDGNPPAKRTKMPLRTSAPKVARPSTKKPAPKSAKAKTPARSKKSAASSSPMADSERRRSGRSRRRQTYVERDSSEDDEEMLKGVAEWEYLSGSEAENRRRRARSNGKDHGSDDDLDDDDDDEDAPEPMDEDEDEEAAIEGEPEEPAADVADEEDEKVEEQEEEEEVEVPPARANGRKTRAAAAAPSPVQAKVQPKPKPAAKPAAKGKPAAKAAAPAKAAPSTSGRSTRGKKTTKADVYDMDEDDD